MVMKITFIDKSEPIALENHHTRLNIVSLNVWTVHIAQSIKNAIEGSRVCEPRIANLCMVVIYKSYLEGLAHRPQSN